MKILIIGVEPASLIGFKAPLIQHLKSLGHEVCVASVTASPDQISTIEAMGARHYTVPFARAGLNPLSDAQTMWALYRLCATLKPDAVLSYTIKPVIYGICAAFMARVKRRVVMIEGLGYSFIEGPELKRKILRSIVKMLYRFTLKRSSMVIFINPDDQADFQKWGLLNRATPTCIVNGVGVDTDYYAPVALPKAPVFLMISRLLIDKGVREFAQAARMASAQVQNIRFQLLGPVDSSPNAIGAEELAGFKELGIEYLGVTQDVRPMISNASVLVLPSYREGIPRSVLEAMSMGRAIITTDVPGCRQTVTDGMNGVLVPARDSTALATAITKLATHHELVQKMGKESRRIAVEKYNAATVAIDTALKAGFSAPVP